MRFLSHLGLMAFAGLGLSASGHAAPEPPRLGFPLACVVGQTCEIQHYVDRDAGPGVRDYRCGTQSYEGHNGIDIRLLDMAAQRRGVDVLAAAAGKVTRLRDGVADISIRTPGAASVANQECGNGVAIDHGGGLESQYCHMARGSIRVKSGDLVAAGAPIGRVGLSGMTEFPHLHLTVRRDGAVVDPFAPSGVSSCDPRGDLWTPQARAAISYKSGVVLNAGFAAGPLTMEQVETGGIAGPSRAAPYVVAYVRGITLQAGDVIVLELKGPDGASLARSQLPPLDRWKAQHLAYVGKKQPPGGWKAGTYAASYEVLRQGKVALSRRFEVRL